MGMRSTATRTEAVAEIMTRGEQDQIKETAGQGGASKADPTRRARKDTSVHR